MALLPPRAGEQRMSLRSVFVAAALTMCGAVMAFPAHPASAASAPVIDLLHLDGEVNAVTADYLSSSLTRAGRDGASAVVLEVNTPGGISTAMDQMETSLLNAPVPVAVFVAPAGARAASAGLFV